ncbi:hypothetical protein [Peribacillus kribbensis]|uniref:hypothetical protein n=1 Tax=Peribacillus kribbensis TaxID=356658 RepID=UPI00040AACA9|nr:hypothetical protein [Peribacillus kribbensis]
MEKGLREAEENRNKAGAVEKRSSQKKAGIAEKGLHEADEGQKNAGTAEKRSS